MNKKEYEPLKGKAQKDKFGVFFDGEAVESALCGLLKKLNTSENSKTYGYYDDMFQEWFPDIMKEGN